MAVIFNCAMRWGFIDLGTNPVSLVRVKGVSRRQKEPRVLNSAEIQKLVAELQEPCRTAVIVALGTGLRCSELFALKWEDINWDELTLSVHRAIVDGVVGDVKTKYSLCGLPLDPALADVLLTWNQASQFREEADWVFASPLKAGELPLRSTAMLETQIKPAVVRANLGGRIGWHTFRHSYSSMLRQLGVDVKVQQELLRHADIRTTINVYTQAVSEQKRAAHSKVVQMVLAS
jgi:integrase